jgi:hypothetical protein
MNKGSWQQMKYDHEVEGRPASSKKIRRKRKKKK